MTSKYPKHLEPTARNWKARKRREIRKAIAGLGDLNYGCAYTPAYEEICHAQAALHRAKQKMSVKEWGR